MDTVTIVIPTYNRPGPLRRAIASVLGQARPDDVAVEILVVDNSDDGNAGAVVARFVAEGAALTHVREPRPGIANVRNAGVAAAHGRWVLFLDDDQEARPNWLASYVATARATGADAVFGPVEARADGGGDIGPFVPYFARRIERPEGSDITALAAYLGTNSALFDRERCFGEGVPFDPSLNEIGGEDSLFLKRLVMAGRRFAWTSGGVAIEWVPKSRTNWSYVWRRKFLSGQIRIFVHHKVTPIQWSRIFLWMAVGAAQVVAAGGLALLLAPIDRVRAAHRLATASGGLGKIFWISACRPHLYGRGLVS